MVYNQHDTWVRSVLMNKREASIFINFALKLKQKNTIKPEILEPQDNRFITKSFYNKETDIIYKLREKNAYVLIEHQSKVDKYMAKRIVEYIVEIIRKDEKDKKIEAKNYKLPLVIPIVLYTGKGKWTAKESIIEIQEKLPGYESKGFGNYIVIDTNKYSEEKLIQNKGILSKIILLDKAKGSKETEIIYDKIKSHELTKEEKEILIEYMCNISSSIVNQDKFIELKEKYRIEGGEKQMLVETLKREIRIESMKRGQKIGQKIGQKLGQEIGQEIGQELGQELGQKLGQKLGQEIGEKKVKEREKEIAKEMLKGNIDISYIKEWTKLSDEELKELKKEVLDKKQ